MCDGAGGWTERCPIFEEARVVRERVPAGCDASGHCVTASQSHAGGTPDAVFGAPESIWLNQHLLGGWEHVSRSVRRHRPQRKMPEYS